MWLMVVGRCVCGMCFVAHYRKIRSYLSQMMLISGDDAGRSIEHGDSAPNATAELCSHLVMINDFGMLYARAFSRSMAVTDIFLTAESDDITLNVERRQEVFVDRLLTR